jgi:uncharacterized protein (DUF488 family)
MARAKTSVNRPTLEAMHERAAPLKFVTVGVYGFTAAAFFEALQQAGVDTFCDIRWRRGVRGAAYAFANRARLEQRLAELGIRYLHVRDLAPRPALRRRQADADQAEGTTKRGRTALGPLFVAGYQAECLAAFDSPKFIEHLGATARTVALFCVEREPAACHRSLLAGRLQQDLGVKVVHLRPPPPPQPAGPAGAVGRVEGTK